jgi:hypothetical protein
MSMRLFLTPTESTSGVRRDEPQPVMGSKFTNDSQPKYETVFGQGPLFPDDSTHDTVEPTDLKKSYTWARKGPIEIDQLLIKETHSISESP